jgi:hypothetical protein
MPETVNLDTLLSEQRAKFLSHLTDDQLHEMAWTTGRRFSRDTLHAIALHLADRLKYPSQRVATREGAKGAGSHT